MTNSDHKQFAEAMAVLSAVFDNGREISRPLIGIYYNALENYTITDIRNAVQRMVKERVYASFPKPAEIVNMISGSVQDRSLEAWVKVANAIARIGNYQSVQFSNPVIHSVIQAMGGWEKCGTFREDEMTWKQKEFERLYEIMEKQAKHPAYLPGIVETGNSATGQGRKQEIVKIGFEEKPKFLTSSPEGRVRGMGK